MQDRNRCDCEMAASSDSDERDYSISRAYFNRSDVGNAG